MPNNLNRLHWVPYISNAQQPRLHWVPYISNAQQPRLHWVPYISNAQQPKQTTLGALYFQCPTT